MTTDISEDQAAGTVQDSSRAKTVLHIGCNRKNKSHLPAFFQSYDEIRLDIDPEVRPDIVADMRDLSQLEDNSVDAIFSSHNIEHVFLHEVVPTLEGWHRVLRPSGVLDLRCPDIEPACRAILEDKAFEALYTSPAGPVTPLDMLYGYTRSLRRGNAFMAHKCGFTKQILGACLTHAGFKKGGVTYGDSTHELRAVVYK